MINFMSIDVAMSEIANYGKGNLLRTFKEYNLNEPITYYISSSYWHELLGDMKKPFDSGFQVEERLFTNDESNMMIGFINERLYKISVLLHKERSNELVNTLMEHYGNPVSQKPLMTWQDNNTGIDLGIDEHNANLIITDRNLLKTAY